MKKLTALFISVILVFSISAPAFAEKLSGEEMYNKLELMSELIREYSLYSDDYDDPIEKALIKLFEENPELFDLIADTMFQSYDEFSHYIPENTYETVYKTSESYVGIGITVEVKEDGIYIASVSPGGPAESAGLKAGDRLVRVDDTDVSGYISTDAIVPLIRGSEDTEVTIGILREGGSEIMSFTVTRKKINYSNITFEDMGDGVAYIGISHFGDINTFIDFVSFYDDLPYNGFRSVIFDVRDNPGGDLYVLLNILNNVIYEKDKNMFALKDRYGYEAFKSSGIGWKPNKIVVLINENSSSASELFAGSLKDWKYADLVGVTTHGKGLGQYHIPNGDTSVSVISNFELILPVTGPYNGVGVTPTYKVELETKPYPLPVFFLLPSDKELFIGSNSTAVLGLEQRLLHLGYFFGTPDNIFDNDTLKAVNLYQNAHLNDSYRLTVEDHCDIKTIKAILSDIEILKNTRVYEHDNQLEKAVEIAKEAAKNPLSYTLPDRTPLSSLK